MKGVVFTEFLKMVDEVFSPEMTEIIIEDADVASKGVYTSTGTYDYTEILQLVIALSNKTGAPVPDLVRTFGEYLFKSFVRIYPQFFEDQTSAFKFLKEVDSYIHIQVHKLYPEAQLPKIDFSELDTKTLELDYKSQCPFAELAHGLITACIEHFNEDITIARSHTAEDGTSAKFILTQQVL